MPDYFIHFAVAHEEFRIPELLSICQLHSIELGLPAPPNDPELLRPIVPVTLPSDEAARLIASRCILVKAIYTLWAHGPTYTVLHEANKANESAWLQYKHGVTFKFIVTSVHHRIPQRRLRETIEEFSYMAWDGEIDLKNPEVVLTCMEEYEAPDPSASRSQNDGKFRHAYFGRLISEDSESRALIGKFDVKQRVFYGNTSMDAEMSLLMANQALASPGKLIYDPFAGTGSMLYTAAHFGALVYGSDIDGRQMRGKASGSKAHGTLRAAAQYGVEHRVMDSMTFDVTQNPWRRGEILDAIVTDPPYGVRAGAKRLGGKVNKKELRTEPVMLPDGVLAHTKPTYIPPTKPYELSSLAQDLVAFALYMLVPGGRLVFFLPTVSDEYQDVDIPIMDGMELVGNSMQDFGKWGRRLITMVKTTSEPQRRPAFLGTEDPAVVGRGLKQDTVPAHKDFRVKYFNRFLPLTGDGNEAEKS